MSLVTYQNVGIAGISAVVPKTVIDSRTFTTLLTEQELENTIETTGIQERRFANEETCSSDLCVEAAERLLSEMPIERDSIDMLIFLSQTPDLRQPATAPMLQHRLGLPKSVGAFDINSACAGYVYGLATSFAFASQKGIDRVLLLVGETLSKIISPQDRATSLLFGDGATATLIEKDGRFGTSFFSMNSDGSGEGVLKIPAGGYRKQSSAETLEKKTYDDGSIRSDEQLFMDGMEVFNFTMREVPKDVKRVAQFAEISLTDIEYIIFHQANKFITDFFAKKLKYPKEQLPYSLHKFGNTSAVSIPLTIVSEMKQILRHQKKQIMLCGYGGGLSWATSVLTLSDCYISELGEI